jgi:hypothetical protein
VIFGAGCKAELRAAFQKDDVPEAARRIGITAKKLSRWIDHNENI